MIEHLVQGHPQHSFHAQAADKLGLRLDDRVGLATHDELYSALRSQEHAAAVVAIVNTQSGRVDSSYPHLLQGGLTVTERVDLRIQHHLLGLKGVQKEAVRVIHTQKPAYDQCKDTIARECPNAVWKSEDDTARSAYLVAELNDPYHAAISPHTAGIAAGLVSLRSGGVQDSAHNTTSFFQVGIGEHAIVPENADITVVALHSDTPGIYDMAKRVVGAMGLHLSTLHPKDASASSLIVEVGANYHDVLSVDATTALNGICTAMRIGGYVTPLAA